MKWRIAFISLFLLLLGCSSSTNRSVVLPEGYRSFNSKQHQTTFIYPDSWYVVEQADQVQIVSSIEVVNNVSRALPKDTATVTVIHMPEISFNPEDSPEENLQEFIELVGLPYEFITEPETLTLGGMEAAKTTLSLEENGQLFTVEMVVFLSPQNRLHLASGIYDDPTLKSDVLRIINSLRFVDDA